jgi:hypothetical protein
VAVASRYNETEVYCITGEMGERSREFNRPTRANFQMKLF